MRRARVVARHPGPSQVQAQRLRSIPVPLGVSTRKSGPARPARPTSNPRSVSAAYRYISRKAGCSAVNAFWRKSGSAIGLNIWRPELFDEPAQVRRVLQVAHGGDKRGRSPPA